ncbi:TIGR00730 family Rossman fold protein [Corynebacterium epidermidicanis]|uniref:Putative TIGR00730 family protein n=1 Tax=Corynebacterium epidermidicanis TaxID=1050174 RepID=A0A0G3GPC8_9CORY|nr:TIGR00730 family Rossman fold protein [Corynebacterium epidermidicanis]AKK03081.1 putative TIGR00730 family protein [Corynebacterium epidermidicanis]
MTTITVAAAIIRNARGDVLTVRKRDTEFFMFPGGKLEPDELPLDALHREVREELGIRLTRVTHFGDFETLAANEDATLRSTVFQAVCTETPTPANEIAELCWVNPQLPQVPLAPLLADAVFPTLPPAINAITVFCGSASGNSPAFTTRAQQLGSAMAENGIDMVYGGGHVGLMGSIADAVLAENGRAVGIIPQHLVDREIAHKDLSELVVVADMHERKMAMAERCDAFIAMPGGAGTLEELFEAWTWQILGLHRKPIALYGRDFWAPMLTMVRDMVDQGFIASRFADNLIVADTPTELLQLLHGWQPSAAKWD